MMKEFACVPSFVNTFLLPFASGGYNGLKVAYGNESLDAAASISLGRRFNPADVGVLVAHLKISSPLSTPSNGNSI
jgi:hypothetical protein